MGITQTQIVSNSTWLHGLYIHVVLLFKRALNSTWQRNYCDNKMYVKMSLVHVHLYRYQRNRVFIKVEVA